MSKNKTGLNLMMLDACRDNPFARSFRSTSTGLAKMEAPSGTLISYAAKPGTRSKDGDGRNGLYTSVLLKYLPIPGMPIEQMLKKVGTEVRQLSRDQQQTWMEGLLDSGDGGDFCFAGCADRAPTPTTPPYKPVEPTPEPTQKSPPIISQRQPVKPPQKPTYETSVQSGKACDICPEMVRLPGGSFLMGSPESEFGSEPDEHPQHHVFVQPFSISKYEVTIKQFSNFVKSTDYHSEPKCITENPTNFADWRNPGFKQKENHPVVCVSVEDALAYARWLNQKVPGKNFRLPTEAEWEYAARAGSNTAFYWGDEVEKSCTFANIYNNSGKTDAPAHCNDGTETTSNVGTYLPNRFGLFDMLGNVWEWTCSAYSSSLSGYDGSENNCRELSELGAESRRGGAWRSDSARSATRDWGGPTGQVDDTGFRLVHD